jgi:hypothetical protein
VAPVSHLRHGEPFPGGQFHSVPFDAAPSVPSRRIGGKDLNTTPFAPTIGPAHAPQVPRSKRAIGVIELCLGPSSVAFMWRISPDRCARPEHSVTYVLSVTKCLTFSKVAADPTLRSVDWTIPLTCQVVTQHRPGPITVIRAFSGIPNGGVRLGNTEWRKAAVAAPWWLVVTQSAISTHGRLTVSLPLSAPQCHSSQPEKLLWASNGKEVADRRPLPKHRRRPFRARGFVLALDVSSSKGRSGRCRVQPVGWLT